MHESSVPSIDLFTEFLTPHEPPLKLQDDTIKISYTTEADARMCFRQLADAYGWLVQEEVVIPGWGRVDLVLRTSPSSSPLLVELKKELRKPSEIRRAFQQADGYGRWWAHHQGESATSILVGIQGDWTRVKPVADAYPEVTCLPGGVFMDRLRNWDKAPGARALRAHNRLTHLETLIAVHRRAVGEMDALAAALLNSQEAGSV
jgi:hypothetical protein